MEDAELNDNQSDDRGPGTQRDTTGRRWLMKMELGSNHQSKLVEVSKLKITKHSGVRREPAGVSRLCRGNLVRIFGVCRRLT